MKRIIVLFVLLVSGLSFGLWWKVRENKLILSSPAGGSGVIEGMEVDIGSRLASRIRQIHVREGEQVEAGQMLVELDCREGLAALAAAKARLAMAESSALAARAQIDASQGQAQAAAAGAMATGAQYSALQANEAETARQVQRLKKLQGEGGATVSDLDRASTAATELKERIRALKANESAARNQAAAARAQASAARKQAEATLSAVTAAQADVARAQVLVDECQLKSPIKGIVLTRAYEPGEAVLPGARILTVVQLSTVKTTFYLPNRELAMAAPGRQVTIRADAYPQKSFMGAISAVAAEAEFTSRNVQTREDRDRLVYAVEVNIPNEEHLLRPGMPVEVVIERAAQ